MRSNVGNSVISSGFSSNTEHRSDSDRAASKIVRQRLDAPELESPQSRMLIALNATGKPMYQGTVSPALKARRRAANKRARKARRV